MNKALLRKECKSLLPWCILLFGSQALGIIVTHYNSYWDWLQWVDLNPFVTLDANNREGQLVSYTLIGLLLAYTMFPKEREDRTLAFLHSLPVKRSAVFWHKFAVVFGLLVLLFVTEQLSYYVMQALNPEWHAQQQFRLDLAWSTSVLYLAFASVVLCQGILVSYYARTGLLLYLIYWGVLLGLTTKLPSLSWLSPGALVTLKFSGKDLLFPWSLFAFHMGVGVISLLLGLRLWNRDTDIPTTLPKWLQRLTGGVFAVLAVGFVLLLVIGIMMGPITSQPRKAASQQPIHFAKTKHYHFAYPSTLRGRVSKLLQPADDIFEGLARTLGVEKTRRVIADLSYQGSHVLGFAAGWKMRMDLVAHQSKRALLHTLAHETTHTLSMALLGEEGKKRGTEIHFYMEGLAEYLADQYSRQPTKRAQIRVLAAVTWKRYKLTFAKLLDHHRLVKRHDERLVYAIGEVWVHAMVKTCGTKTMGGVLKALGDEKLPEQISAMSLWQTALQSCGCDLESVLEEWRNQLNTRAQADLKGKNPIPRLFGGVKKQQDAFVSILGRQVIPSLHSQQGQSQTQTHKPRPIFVRYKRDQSDGGKHTYQSPCKALPRAPTKFLCSIPRGSLGRGSFPFQLCTSLGKGIWPYCETWQTGLLK